MLRTTFKKYDFNYFDTSGIYLEKNLYTCTINPPVVVSVVKVMVDESVVVPSVVLVADCTSGMKAASDTSKSIPVTNLTFPRFILLQQSLVLSNLS